MNYSNVVRIEKALRLFLSKNGECQWQHVRSLAKSIETSIQLDAITNDETVQAKDFFNKAVWGDD